jgi:hypothetical protein
MHPVWLFLLIASLAPVPVLAEEQQLVPTTGLEDDENGTDVLGVFKNSLRLLLLEHGSRVAFQQKTRRELGGNFWHDYRRSVRMPGQWHDTDAWWVNYIGHPIHGAAASYIWLDHTPTAPPTFKSSKSYWSSRGRAMAWAAAYSLQFEMGPLSEASLGNVGLRRETTGWVDHVVTPVGAFGLVVAEDALDRFVVEWIEARVRNRFVRSVARLALNPGRALSNTAAGHLPWYRPSRPLDGAWAK